MSTVGAFVKSKMHNMAVWVQAELGADAAMDYVAAVDARLELELTTIRRSPRCATRSGTHSPSFLRTRGLETGGYMRIREMEMHSARILKKNL